MKNARSVHRSADLTVRGTGRHLLCGHRCRGSWSGFTTPIWFMNIVTAVKVRGRELKTKFIAWGQRVQAKAIKSPPGNSLPIIDLAYRLGYDGIELDVTLSKDGELVLMHDSTIDKSTWGSGKVNQMTVSQLRSVQLRDEWDGRPTYISTFEEALRVNGARGYVMVDLRILNDKSLSALHGAINDADFDNEKLLFLAYNRDAGLRLTAAFPDSLVMLKAPINLKPPELTVDFIYQSDGLGSIIVPTVAYPEVTLDFVKAARDRNQKIGVYLHHQGMTTLRPLLEMGVDFITSMNPAVIDQARKEMRAARG